jgi:hypothetical protein
MPLLSDRCTCATKSPYKCIAMQPTNRGLQCAAWPPILQETPSKAQGGACPVMQTITFEFSWLPCMQHCQLAPKQVVCNAAYQDETIAAATDAVLLGCADQEENLGLTWRLHTIKFSRERMVQQKKLIHVIKKRPGSAGVSRPMRADRHRTTVDQACNWSMLPAYSTPHSQ